jgi:hypothetical protein
MHGQPCTTVTDAASFIQTSPVIILSMSARKGLTISPASACGQKDGRALVVILP